MTLTTGLAPIATAVDTTSAPVTRRDVLALPARSGRRRIGWLVVALDVLAAFSALSLTVSVAPEGGRVVLTVLAVAWPLVVAGVGGYEQLSEDPYAIRARALLTAGVALAAAVWVAVALVPGATDGATPHAIAVGTLLFVSSACVASLAGRVSVPVLAPRTPLPVVLVGPGAEVRALLREADRQPRNRGFAPVAACLPDGEEIGDSASWPFPVWHGVEDHLLDVVRHHGAEGVVVVPSPGIGHEQLRRWATWLQDSGVQLLLSSGLRDVSRARLGAASLGGTHLVRVSPARITGAGQWLKGAFDRVTALALLLAFAPLLGLLTVLIRTDSPGPAWFRQVRVGQHGRRFTVYKLRTMRQDADRVLRELDDANESDRDGVLFKIKHDPRITRVGAVLRRYSLDELPQLVNVLRGDMSLIGPRPALPREVEAYSPDLHRRLVVKPGLTGLWQVSGRSDLSWEDTVRLDLQYVDNWSWGLDLRIAARTVSAVLSHRGAY